LFLGIGVGELRKQGWGWIDTNLIFRAFRSDCRPRLADIFRIQVISNPQVRSPIPRTTIAAEGTKNEVFALLIEYEDPREHIVVGESKIAHFKI
jgi:hypothetical protein